MTLVSNVSGLIPGVMSLALVSHTVKTIPQGWGPKGVKKVGSKDIVKGFVPIMIGVPMIRATSSMVSVL